MNSGTTGLFLFFEKTMNPERTANGGEDPAPKQEIVLSAKAVLTDSHRLQPRKEGKLNTMKFATIAAVAALAIAALGLGACASKPAPAPAPSSIGTSK